MRERRKLGVYSLGLLKNRSLKIALRALGWEMVFGPLSSKLDAVGVWGSRPVSLRGHKAAARRNLPVIYIEDAFLRSVTTSGSIPIMGLTLDNLRHYVDARGPSDLENLLNKPFEAEKFDLGLLDAYLQSGLSKYNTTMEGEDEVPDKGFVLVVDQLRGDVSIALGLANESNFAAMLQSALRENPGVPVYIKRHPRSISDPSKSHFDAKDLNERVRFLSDTCSIPEILRAASKVYAVTSQLGFEAVLYGHKPRIFGHPFYAGWGLTHDEEPIERREITHTVLSLFSRAVVEYPSWIDVYQQRTCDFVTALRGLEARRNAYHRLKAPTIALGMSGWKRPFIKQVLSPLKFANTEDRALKQAKFMDASVSVWASRASEGLSDLCKNSDVRLTRVEDGFLRSVGLGAELVEPMSLCFDNLGIYYDPNEPSRLEQLIKDSAHLPKEALLRASKLREALIRGNLSKYNEGEHLVLNRPKRQSLLVVGQVEDDASILKGALEVRTNREVLRIAREQNRDAYIYFKPHPDVEAGLRVGEVPDALDFADEVLSKVSSASAIDAVDEVWTITSLLGFEALLRGRKTICLGRPFYAGWGLTTDHFEPMPRRDFEASLDGLIHASLIDYPLYFDPDSKLPCPVETIVERLLTRREKPVGPKSRLLAKGQRLIKGFSNSAGRKT